VHHRETRLAARLHGDARDEVADEHHRDLGLAHHLGDRDVLLVLHGGHDVIRLGAPVGGVGDGQDGLDDRDVRVLVLG
jgi:hypothetical protein